MMSDQRAKDFAIDTGKGSVLEVASMQYYGMYDVLGLLELQSSPTAYRMSSSGSSVRVDLSLPQSVVCGATDHVSAM